MSLGTIDPIELEMLKSKYPELVKLMDENTIDINLLPQIIEVVVSDKVGNFDTSKLDLIKWDTINTLESSTDTFNEPEPLIRPSGLITSLSFDEDEHDFGEVEEGEIVTHVFRLQNTWEQPLVISNAKATCGCTVPHWPKDPIVPGDYAEIQVDFDTKNKGIIGGKPQSKRIRIITNTDPVNNYLTVKCVVKK